MEISNFSAFSDNEEKYKDPINEIVEMAGMKFFSHAIFIYLLNDQFQTSPPTSD